jgi:DNA mismatch repair protein MutL
MSFPQIFFSLTSNGQEVFHLDAGTLKQRILQLLGNSYNAKLVAVKEETDYMNIHGFIGKPETAKKTRGDQYFFVNNRFIKSPYLNHALSGAYQEMIAHDSFPMYVLFIDINPEQVDVNVHPTKQEIKFEDEKIVYAFVQAAVKHALAQFSITPTLDFELDASIQQLDSIQKPFTEERQSAAKFTSLFQTFTQANQAHRIERSGVGFEKAGQETEAGFQSLGRFLLEREEEPAPYSPIETPETLQHSALFIHETKLTQLFNSYILLPAAQYFLLIHQQAAHERIIYERLQKALDGKAVATQQSLFPTTLELVPSDVVLLMELLPDLQQFGYAIEPFGKNAFVIQGTPADVLAGNEKYVLEKLLEQYKHFTSELKFSKREILLRSLAWQQSVKAGTQLGEREMQTLVEELFTCEQPNATPSGKPTYMEFKKDNLEKMFGR